MMNPVLPNSFLVEFGRFETAVGLSLRPKNIIPNQYKS
jgi:hypothetical protein